MPKVSLGPARSAASGRTFSCACYGNPRSEDVPFDCQFIPRFFDRFVGGLSCKLSHVRALSRYDLDAFKTCSHREFEFTNSSGFDFVPQLPENSAFQEVSTDVRLCLTVTSLYIIVGLGLVLAFM